MNEMDPFYIQYKLKAAGYIQRNIADETGFSADTVSKVIKKTAAKTDTSRTVASRICEVAGLLPAEAFPEYFDIHS